VKVNQSVANTPFRARTYPVTPKNIALIAMKASKHPIEGISSDARRTNREPARGKDHGNREERSDPPRREDAPPDAEPRWRLRVKNLWVKNGEVFDTDSRGELVVNDSI
jgi:hypothetical protein